MDPISKQTDFKKCARSGQSLWSEPARRRLRCPASSRSPAARSPCIVRARRCRRCSGRLCRTPTAPAQPGRVNTPPAHGRRPPHANRPRAAAVLTHSIEEIPLTCQHEPVPQLPHPPLIAGLGRADDQHYSFSWTRDGQVLSDVTPRRYFCTACHVPQSDVPSARAEHSFPGHALAPSAPGRAGEHMITSGLWKTCLLRYWNLDDPPFGELSDSLRSAS